MPVSPDLVTAQVPRAARDTMAGDLQAVLAARSFDSIHDVAVLDGERLGLALQLVMLALLVALVRVDWVKIMGRDRAGPAGP